MSKVHVSLLIFCLYSMCGYAAVERPNIIVIMADDHGQWATGAYGLSQMHTPNLDYMADQGVLFSNAMSPAPVCSPARASFYTGKMPSQHGVHDYLQEDRGRKYDANWLEGETLLSQRLQDEGYRTGLFGKWHATTDSAAVQPGFDHWLSYDTLKAGWQNQYLHRGTVYFSDNEKPREYTGVQARYLTEEAVKFIDVPSSKPFFINLNFVEPHAPFDGLPERLVSQYRLVARDIIRAGGASDLKNLNASTLVPADHEEKLAQYLAAVSLVDDQLGRLLDALEGRDLLRNTLVVYVADHGMLVGQYGLYGKTNASNPVNFYEETIRIPLVFYGAPELLRSGQTRAEFVDLIDLHATIRDFAGGGSTVRSDYGPGRSVRSLLEGARDPDWKKYHFAERGNARMISNGHWKLVRYYKRDGAEAPEDHWYDLSHPLGERHRSEPPRSALRSKMVAELEAFFLRYEEPGKTGREIWTQPYPNAKMEKILK